MKNNKLYQLRMPVLRALCAVIFVFASANSALAQDWRFEPIFKMGGEFDDNATLNPRTDQEVDLSGLIFEAKADVYYSSPTTEFFAQPRVHVKNFNDDVVLDSDDYFLRSTFRRQAKLNTVGFRVNYDQQSVRTGERTDSDLEIEDPDEITNDDTGRVLRIGDRKKWRVSPYWEYRLSSLSSIGARLDYTDTQYDDVFAGILTDFSDTRLGLNYERSLSNLTAWQISLTGRSYDSESSPEEVRGYGVLAGIKHALSEKTRISAAIGFEDTDKSDSETDSEVVGFVTLTRNLESIRFFAQLRRSANGSGAGTVSIRDSLNLNFRRRLNERLSAGLGVRAYQTRVGSGALLSEGRNYVQLQWRLSWYLSRSFVIQAEYRYTVIDRGETRDETLGEILGQRANSNRIGLWFTYQPKTAPRI
jgi:hypothetical protein